MSEEPPKPQSRKERRAAARAPGTSETAAQAAATAKARVSLRELSQAIPNAADLSAARREFSKTGNDKAAILLHAAILDAHLAQCIEVHITLNASATVSKSEIQSILFDDHAALSTFSAKIHLAYLLGIIDKDGKNDLDCIRRIRNAFAHSAVPLDTNTRQVGRECEKLRLKIEPIVVSENRDLILLSYLALLEQMIRYLTSISGQGGTVASLHKSAPQHRHLTRIVRRVKTMLGLPPRSSRA